jgi:hypothetical protein
LKPSAFSLCRISFSTAQTGTLVHLTPLEIQAIFVAEVRPISKLNCYSGGGATWYILSPGPGALRGFGPPPQSDEGALRGNRRCERLKISAFF